VTGAYVDSDYNLQPQNQVKVVVQEAAKLSRAQRTAQTKKRIKAEKRINADIVAIANQNVPADTAPDKKVKKPNVYGKTISPTTSTTGDKETKLPNQRPHAVKHFKILRNKRVDNTVARLIGGNMELINKEGGKKFVSTDAVKARRHSMARKSLSKPGQKIGDVLKKGAKELATTVSQGVKKVKSDYAASKAANSADSYSPKSDKSWSSKTSNPETRKAAAPAPAEKPKETVLTSKPKDNSKTGKFNKVQKSTAAQSADPNAASKGQNRGGKRAQGSTIIAAKSESFSVIRPEEEQE